LHKNHGCTDTGTTKPHRLTENNGAAFIELTPGDLVEIEEAASKSK